MARITENDRRDPRGPEMVAMLEGGALRKEVAAAFGLSEERVRMLVRGAGYEVDLRSKPGTYRSRADAQLVRRKRAQEVLAERPRATYAEIAEAIGAEETSVRRYVYLDGDPRREERRRARSVEHSMRSLAQPSGKKISDEDLLAQIRAAAEKLGEPLGVKRFDAFVGHQRSQLATRRFGSWHAACARAGVRCGRRPPGMGEETWSRDELVAIVREVFGSNGYVSHRRWAELRPDGPSRHTLESRLGPWREVARIGLGGEG